MRMYKPAEVAKIANCHVSYVYRLILLGTLPAVRPFGPRGHSWIAEADVRKFAKLSDGCMLPDPKRPYPARPAPAV